MSKLMLEMVKTDLKNTFENPQIDRITKVASINDATKWLTILGNDTIDKVIREYRDSQKQLEEDFINAQNKLWENAENIYNHIMTEL